MDCMSPDEAQIIERLRYAAREHGEVYDLLVVLNDAVLIDGCGNKTLENASNDDIRYIQAAQFALAFCQIDRGETDGKGVDRE